MNAFKSNKQFDDGNLSAAKKWSWIETYISWSPSPETSKMVKISTVGQPSGKLCGFKVWAISAELWTWWVARSQLFAEPQKIMNYQKTPHAKWWRFVPKKVSKSDRKWPFWAFLSFFGSFFNARFGALWTDLPKIFCPELKDICP